MFRDSTGYNPPGDLVAFGTNDKSSCFLTSVCCALIQLMVANDDNFFNSVIYEIASCPFIDSNRGPQSNREKSLSWLTPSMIRNGSIALLMDCHDKDFSSSKKGFYCLEKMIGYLDQRASWLIFLELALRQVALKKTNVDWMTEKTRKEHELKKIRLYEHRDVYDTVLPRCSEFPRAMLKNATFVGQNTKIVIGAQEKEDRATEYMHENEILNLGVSDCIIVVHMNTVVGVVVGDKITKVLEKSPENQGPLSVSERRVKNPQKISDAWAQQIINTKDHPRPDSCKDQKNTSDGAVHEDQTP